MSVGCQLPMNYRLILLRILDTAWRYWYGSIDGGTQQALDDVWNGVMANNIKNIRYGDDDEGVFFFK